MSHVATLTIDHTKVSADLTDYPVLVIANGDAGWADLYALAQEGGGDIRVFKSDDSTELPREIVSFSVSAETGEIHFKFSGTLSSSVDTDIHFYADGSSSDYAVGATYGRNAVWSDYFGVWHFQGAAATSGKLLDATGNGENWTENNSPSSASGVQGQANGSYDMRGSSPAVGSTTGMDWLNMPSVMADIAASPFTMSIWFKPHIEHSTTVALFREEDNGATGRKNFGLWLDSDEKISAGYAPDGSNSYNVGATANAATVNAWSYGVFRRLVSSLYPSVTLNGGTTVIGTTGGGTFSGGNNSFFLNRRYNSTYSNSQRYMDGQYGEMRMRFDDVGESWLTTEYNNQNNEATFWGTWTDAGGGGAAQAARRGVVMMM